MGFRSGFVTSSYFVEWPKWFVDKYDGNVHFKDGNIGQLASKNEQKLGVQWADLASDIQRALDDDLGWFDSDIEFIIMFLHECDGCTRCHINKDSIKWSEPTGWEWHKSNTHSHCFKCSDPVPEVVEKYNE